VAVNVNLGLHTILLLESQDW